MVPFLFLGTSVIQVTASDADDPTYGNSAKLVYSILEGQPYFSVEAQTGIATNEWTPTSLAKIAECRRPAWVSQVFASGERLYILPQAPPTMA